jgi:hypothetical protein
MVADTGISTGLAELLAEDDINVRVVSLNAKVFQPRDTKAIRTLERILSDHGPGHLRMVLSLILQSANNATELRAPTIRAVSRLLTAHPEWDDISVWFDVFDETPIGIYRRTLSQNVHACPVPEAMTTVLFLLLAERFGVASPQLRLPGVQ